MIGGFSAETHTEATEVTTSLVTNAGAHGAYGGVRGADAGLALRVTDALEASSPHPQAHPSHEGSSLLIT